MSSANHHLVTLRAKVDAHFDAAVARTPSAFTCREGCEQCCHTRISVFAVEAGPIRAALAELAEADPTLRAQVREQGNDPTSTTCALLVRGRCTVYAQRPLICRSHGLPIAVPSPEHQPGQPLTVDHCPLNFETDPIPRTSVLVLDHINQPLAMVSELDSPGAPRVALAALAAE